MDPTPSLYCPHWWHFNATTATKKQQVKQINNNKVVHLAEATPIIADANENFSKVISTLGSVCNVTTLSRRRLRWYWWLKRRGASLAARVNVCVIVKGSVNALVVDFCCIESSKILFTVQRNVCLICTICRNNKLDVFWF